MEQEFKWQGAPQQLSSLLNALNLKQPDEILSMSAVYYDTPDGLLSHQKAGLRIRQENTNSICCLKISQQAENGLFQRLEYEVPASDIREGLKKLLAAGAPETLCRSLGQTELVPICRTDFTRQAYWYETPNFTMELAFDQGYFNQKTPFCEWEAERKSGSAEAFCHFCRQFAARQGLIPQPLSKLARALADC